MGTIVKDLGAVSAYAYAVEQGYTGTEQEYAELMASYATVAEAAEASAQAAAGSASDASGSAAQAGQSATNAASSASAAASSASQAQTAAGAAAQSKTDAAASATAAAGSASEAALSATQAANSAQSANSSASDADAAKQGAEAAQAAAETAQGKAEVAQGKAEEAQSAAENAAQGVQSGLEQIETNRQDIEVLTARVGSLEDAEGMHRYGVSGLEQSASALTRLWDAVGMTAQVGTDGDNSNVINDFDHVTPFNRRKCVGNWTMFDGRPHFNVQAYSTDEDYAEDGSMGDYVAVECPKAYYYMKDGVLGVSAHKWSDEWHPFKIFCHELDEAKGVMPFAYIPAYALAVKDGKAVCLPGLDNAQGHYKQLTDLARTYAGDAGSKAILMPAELDFYEWAMMTVEFAQQVKGNVMKGCISLRNNAADRIVFTDAAHGITNSYFAARVVGECVTIMTAGTSEYGVAYQATHRITNVIRCDEHGNEDAAGTHQLLTLEDLGKGYITYAVGTEYSLASRPWRTGDCNAVSTPSGSPVSNSDGFHPMKYRHRENVYGNQLKTASNLFNKRVGTGDEDYGLEWYHLDAPQDYEPSASSKPDAADLATDKFTLMDATTPHAEYKNGYMKTRQYSANVADVWIPGEIGASVSTYYGYYAYLVHSHVVRSCRFGGHWYLGSPFLTAYISPANGNALYGGDLCFAQ